LILNSDFDAGRAQAELNPAIGDAVAFGRPSIANPDLPQRVAEGLPSARGDARTWVAQGAEGFLDYFAHA